jgi:hypothetical protein
VWRVIYRNIHHTFVYFEIKTSVICSYSILKSRSATNRVERVEYCVNEIRRKESYPTVFAPAQGTEMSETKFAVIFFLIGDTFFIYAYKLSYTRYCVYLVLSYINCLPSF